MRFATVAALGLGAILLITGSGIKMAFAQANQDAPGQNFGFGHRNPSGGSLPPGQAHSPPVGNSGQCLKAGYPKGKGFSDCMPKL